jgi:cobalt-zinc-cadmium efflux system outer membrane protein
LLTALAWAVFAASSGRADPPPVGPEPLPEVLSREAAVQWALQYNPEIATLRQQHGIAAAAVVIAQTYPFNPIWEAKVRATNGPESAGITNRVSNEHKVLLDVEVRGQGRYRRQGARAALSRTDSEIAFQEVALAVRTARTFDTLLYRWDKVRLAEETVQLNQKAAEQVRKLVDAGRLRGADLLLIRTEVNDFLAQLSPARASLVTVQTDLRRALGAVSETFDVTGTLETAPPEIDAEQLLAEALEHRADLRAQEAAVAEADARLRLEVRNRFGNPNVGPAYEYDPTRVNLIGVQFSLPLPVFNTHKGEILQREAERARAALLLHQTEVLVAQDVHAAIARLKAASDWVETYRTKVLPELRTSQEGIEKLFAAGDPGVDVLKVIDIRRKLLKARDGYLDALWELSQARADLAAAVGDPTLTFGPCPTAQPAPPAPAPGPEAPKG